MHENAAEPSIVTTEDGSVWTIRLNRPARMNALDPTSIGVLRHELSLFRDSSSAHVCILTGTGTRSFCTGADLRQTLPPSDSFATAMFAADEQSIEMGNYIRGLDIERLQIGKPIIAAINGFAVGGGLELALACDIRLGSENAMLGLPEVKRGSIPAVGGIQRLMRSVPHSAAMTMILTGANLDAVSAARIGLLSEVLPPNRLMPRAIELAREITANAPLAVKAARMLAIQGADMTISQAMLLEQLAWGVLRNTADRVEGRKAFAEKRPPVFTGR
jgi:enoyl-CoA hydratase/carnithine racemase